MLCTLPYEIIQTIAQYHVANDKIFLEKYVAKNIAVMIKLLSNLCVCSTMYTYYIENNNHHVPGIKIKIVEDIYSKFALMDTQMGELYDKDIQDISIYFNRIGHGLSYADFKAPVNQNIYLPYWYCCLTLFSTEEMIKDFLATVPTQEILINCLKFLLVGSKSKGDSYSNNCYYYDGNRRGKLFGNDFFISEIQPYIKQVSYTIYESDSDEEDQTVVIDDRTNAIILLIDEITSDVYWSIFDLIILLIKDYDDYLLNDESINIMTYIFRVTQKKRIDFMSSLNILLYELTLCKRAMSILKKERRDYQLVSAVHFGDIVMLKKFFLGENEVIDPILKVTKPYNNTKKAKRPRWMRFEREFPDLYEKEKSYKRDMNDRCDRKNHNRSFVDESKINANELALYETDEAEKANIC
uniref:Uncharacterized protein n=1 Tax=viral metagenome TaxID=1070528 RepID=A0A6C0C7W1_9ZZZZ